MPPLPLTAPCFPTFSCTLAGPAGTQRSNPALEAKGATVHWKPSLWELKMGLKRLSLLMVAEVSHSLDERKIRKSLTTQARLLHLGKVRIPQCKHLLGQPLVGTMEDNAICCTHFSLLMFLSRLQPKIDALALFRVLKMCFSTNHF